MASLTGAGQGLGRGWVGNVVSRLSLSLALTSNGHSQGPACLPSPVCPLRDDGPWLLLGPKWGEGEGISSRHLVPFLPLLPLAGWVPELVHQAAVAVHLPAGADRQART